MLTHAAQQPFQQEEFLPVESAFVVNKDFTTKGLTIIFDSAPGYYLYKDRFAFWLSDQKNKRPLGFKIALPQGKQKNDPYFGSVQVYYNQLAIAVQFDLSTQQQTLLKKSQLSLFYTYQGCAEAGLCYPPQIKAISLPTNLITKTLPANGRMSDNQHQVKTPANKKRVTTINNATTNNTAHTATSIQLNPMSASSNEAHLDNSQTLVDKLKAKNFGAIVSFFLLGILLAFTPCVLPMVPILSSLILGNQNIAASRASFLSFIYVLGMAATYALLGVAVAYFGAKANLQLYIQQPSVIIAMALLFVLLALSMFGFFELKLPSIIQQSIARLNQRTNGGSLIGVLLMGIVSALVVSPCVSAPLAGALIYISSTGDVGFGGLALFSLALGMGVPLLLIGTLGPRFLPKSGNWLNSSKSVLAMLLLAVAIWLVARILPSIIDMLLWAFWALAFAHFLGAFKQANSTIGKLLKIIGIITALGAGALCYQIYNLVFNNKIDVISNAHLQLQTVRTQTALAAILEKNKQQGFYSLVDIYAEWCVACISMEKEIFLQPDVHAQLSKLRFIKFDATSVDHETKQVFIKYDVKGLPNIMLFDLNANEISQARLVGEVNKAQFLAHIKLFIK